MMGVYIVAEAGVNHNGSEELAFRLVDAAVDAGADAVKFQIFKTEESVTKEAAKADYQKYTTNLVESQFDMLKKLELSYETYYKLVSYCKEKKIDFFATAFDIKSLNFLVDKLGVSQLKIPSGDITNGPLLLAYAQTGCDLIVSTGMATLGEVEDALAVLAFGLQNDTDLSEPPSQSAFQYAYCSKIGQEKLNKKVTLLHCTTEYPAALNEINLRAINTLRNAFGLRIGYSDHSEGIIIPTAAVSMGVSLIEKHFTLDKALSGPDHRASLDPSELSEMVTSIRSIEQAMGDGIKRPMLSELKNLSIVRKSLVCSKKIRSGGVYSVDNLTVKRPAAGISPMEYWEFIGKVSQRDYAEDELI